MQARDDDKVEEVGLFDAILSLEESFTADGRQVGLAAGRVSGSRDARLFGAGKGFAVGEEVGFYLGAAFMCRRLGAPQRPKSVAVAHAVLVMARASPVRAPPSHQCDVLAQLECLRAKFKLLRSLLGAQAIPEVDARRRFVAKHLTF